MYSELFLNKGTPLLAVDIGLSTITVAQLNLSGKQYELMNIWVGIPHMGYCIFIF